MQGQDQLFSAKWRCVCGLICPSAKFANQNSQAAALQTLGGAGGDAGSCQGVPSIYLSLPVNDRWSFGFGLNAPFGLTTDYDSDWIGRFQSLKSEIKTIKLNPGPAF
jgi:long-chain fatty acid transport protein